jgi:hypothetical protein
VLYVVNINFDGNVAGEYIEADASLVEDWAEAGFISPVDPRGDRIVDPNRPIANGLQPDRVLRLEPDE